jgi:iron complex transport system substrate-binding protein
VSKLFAFIFLVATSIISFETKASCEEKLTSLNYRPYQNQYEKSFSIYQNDKVFFWNLNNQWFVNLENHALTPCSHAKYIPPADRIVLMSSTLLEVFYELNFAEKIVGLGEKKYIFHNDERIKGAVDLGTSPEVEKIIALKPDILFGYKSPVLNGFYKKLEEMNVRIIYINDYALNHPLARAELRVLLGVFLGEFVDSKKRFQKIVTQYLNYKNIVNSRVKVLTGNQTPSGAWKKLSPETDFYKVLVDAGALDVLSTISDVNISAEEVLKYIDKVDHWLPQHAYYHLNEIKKESNFLRILLKNSTFRVSTYSKKINARGGAEFWDVAMMRPDILLLDLIKVLGTSDKTKNIDTRWYRTLRK